MAPVSGTIAFADGTPIKGEIMTVRFVPDGIAPVGNKAAQVASGTLQQDGTFKLNVANYDGAAVGNYNVELVVMEVYAGPQVKYDLGAREVKPGGSEFEFKVDKASGKPGR